MGMYTGVSRLTGLSGIDTESMISQLMKAESAKLYRYQRSSQTLQWKQDAYRQTGTALKDYQRNFFDFTSTKLNFLSTATFTNSTSKITDSSGKTSGAVSVSGTSNTTNKNSTINVIQKASTDIYTSSAGNIENAISGEEISPDFLNKIQPGDKISFTVDGISRSISLDDLDKTDLTSFTNSLNDKLGETFGKLDGNNKASVSLTDNKLKFVAADGSVLRVSEVPRETTVTGADIDWDTVADGEVFDFVIDGNTYLITKEEGMNKSEFLNKFNEKLKENDSGLRVSSSGEKIIFSNPNSTKEISISGTGLEKLGHDPAGVTVKETNLLQEMGIKSGSTTELSLKGSAMEVLGLTETSFSINGKEITYDSNTTVEEFMRKVNDSATGAKMTYDSVKRSFTLESTRTGEANKLNVTGAGASELLNVFGGAPKQEAKDAVFEYNGDKMSRESNIFEIDGLRIELKEVTTEALNISVTGDTTKTLDNIKSFVEEYNNIIDLLNKDVSTTKTKNKSKTTFKPLTDDEKEAMTEKEIEKWEEKAKTGLLYGDDILKGVLTELRTMMYTPVEMPDGRKLTLSDIGITTTKNYSDGGKLEIDEKKLTAAIEEYGDDVVTLFTKDSSKSTRTDYGEKLKEEGISSRINDILTKATSSNGTIANRAGFKNSLSETTNDLYKQIKEQENKLDDIRAFLVKKETQYYNMFSKLESAIMRANSQADYVSSFFAKQ